MIVHEIRDLTIRAKIPVRRCDGCGKLDDASAIVSLEWSSEGNYFDAFRPAAAGWNGLAINGTALDLCSACTAKAVLARRQEAAAVRVPNGSAPAPARTPDGPALAPSETPPDASAPEQQELKL